MSDRLPDLPSCSARWAISRGTDRRCQRSALRPLASGARRPDGPPDLARRTSSAPANLCASVRVCQLKSSQPSRLASKLLISRQQVRRVLEIGRSRCHVGQLDRTAFRASHWHLVLISGEIYVVSRVTLAACSPPPRNEPTHDAHQCDRRASHSHRGGDDRYRPDINGRRPTSVHRPDACWTEGRKRRTSTISSALQIGGVNGPGATWRRRVKLIVFSPLDGLPTGACEPALLDRDKRKRYIIERALWQR